MTTTEKKAFSVKDTVLCACFASVFCIISPFTVPIGPVPLSLCNFVIMTASAILGGIRGCVATSVFLLAGILGLPVFGGGMGGIGHLLSPTGGFIIAYPLMAALTGALATVGRKRKFFKIPLTLIGCFLSVLLGYIIGTVWYAVAANVPFSAKLLGICVLPFALFDGLKCIGATVIAGLVSSRLKGQIEKKS